jgi:transcriptional regulator with XRE-family HTH domain
MTMITPEQCRAARTLRSLSLAKLAAAAGISETEIDDFEMERRPLDPAALDALQRTLEEAGVAFLPGGDVRLLAAAAASADARITRRRPFRC